MRGITAQEGAKAIVASEDAIMVRADDERRIEADWTSLVTPTDENTSAYLPKVFDRAIHRVIAEGLSMSGAELWCNTSVYKAIQYLHEQEPATIRDNHGTLEYRGLKMRHEKSLDGDDNGYLLLPGPGVATVVVKVVGLPKAHPAKA